MIELGTNNFYIELPLKDPTKKVTPAMTMVKSLDFNILLNFNEFYQATLNRPNRQITKLFFLSNRTKIS